MPQNLYTTIVWPLAAVKDTVIVLISSPKSANHHVSLLMMKTMPDDPTIYIFFLCSVSDECAACLRKGLQRGEKCTHQMATIPDHLSSTNQRMLESLYDDAEFGEQELKGNPVSRTELPFLPFLNRFVALAHNEPYHFSQDVQII